MKGQREPKAVSMVSIMRKTIRKPTQGRIFDVIKVVLELTVDVIDVGDMPLVDRPKSPASRHGDGSRRVTRGFTRWTTSRTPDAAR